MSDIAKSRAEFEGLLEQYRLKVQNLTENFASDVYGLTERNQTPCLFTLDGIINADNALLLEMGQSIYFTNETETPIIRKALSKKIGAQNSNGGCLV